MSSGLIGSRSTLAALYTLKSKASFFAFSLLAALLLGGCTKISNPGTTATAPQITTQPTSQSIEAGTSATFTVVASGTEPLSYQWAKNGTAIGGANSASYTTPLTAVSDSGALFTVIVSNAAGSVTSNAATLTVTAVATPPSITQEPANQTVTAGATATFTVVATGTSPLSYQWMKNGVNITGAVSASYTTPATKSADNATTFSVMITNAAGSVTSNPATLTVTAAPLAPTITSQPTSASVTVGATATFTVVATGTAPLTYQWFKNGAALSGATAATYTTPATTLSDTGAMFKVTVTDAAGSVTSSTVTLTVTAAAVAPSITTEPAPQTVTVGSTATFSVIATGTLPLTYQWSKNGAMIAGATGSTYTTPATALADNNATFSVLVSNTAGSIASTAAKLTVNAVPPSITTQPTSKTVTAGATVTFSVVAAGTPPLSYQWSRGGTAIPGATSASYTTPATVPSDNNATFNVVITNSAGSVTSNTVTLTVNAMGPSITTQPVSQTVNIGQTATFTVVASGTAPLAYQWSRGGVPLSGATNASYTTPATTSADSGAVFTVVVSNSGGTTTSNAATLTVNSVAPGITTQPTDQTVTVGSTATFTVVASGSAPLTYQWTKGGVNINGATAASYTTPATALTDDGSTFAVTVTNAGGSITSATVTLTVNSVSPVITTQPANQAVLAGATATFSVVANGTAPLSYQWSVGGTPISGATAASYTTPVTTLTDNGSSFTVTITNGGGSVTSNPAILTVSSAVTAPSITTQPANKTVTVGQTATFTVAANGTQPFTYQWSKSGSTISGATSASYTTPATVLADNGATFTVVVTNSAGSATSNAATLTVNAVAPTIMTQPANQTVTVGHTATFTVTASGTAPFTYQWSKNGSAISGATSASYTTPATVLGDSGARFTVAVTNSAGTATSNAATLTVNAIAPSITTQPTNQTVTQGATATFSVVASGTAPLSYQWSKNGTAITGATSASYTTPATTSADNGSSFTVTVSNSAGSVTSNAASLTVNAVPPTITTQPTNQSVTVGATATFTVVASGSTPLSYQWSKNGSAISGATSASYTTPATVSGDSGATFQVVVSNSGGSATSNSVTLTVNAAAPTITTQPTNQTVTVGTTATFSVIASGTAPLSYQWSKNGTPISGATAANYTTPATVSGDNGATFKVVVSNTGGSATSNTVTLTVQAAGAGVDVTTYHNDVARTGQNLQETILTKANVNSTTFGLLRKLAVDGKVDAQPLVLSQFNIGGGVHNVAFVATEHDSVYAFDVDSGGVPYWQVSLALSGETSSDPIGCDQISPEIGITSTPVIDRAAGRMYVVAMSKDGSGNYYHRLHALNLSTGADAQPPTTITASIAAGPDVPVDITNGQMVFKPSQYTERSALLLSNGIIYTSWTSHCDNPQYSGWIIAYKAADLTQAAVYNDEPDGNNGGGWGEGAFWNSASGPAADAAGNIYVMSGNGIFDTTFTNGFPAHGDYGNSFIKLAPPAGNTMAVLDYFTMYNSNAESSADLDLGSGGIMLIPDQKDASGNTKQLVVGAGKDHLIYLLDRNNLGHFNAADNSNAYQAFDAFSQSPALQGCMSSQPGVYGAPVYFNGVLYYNAANDTIRTWPFTNAKLPTSSAQSTPSTVAFCYPGATMAISANGTSNGILWATQNSTTSSGTLHAFDADNIGTELYNSTSAGDAYGPGSKWTVPTIANGKVLVTTQGNTGTPNYLAIFGLK